jgi:hypothetical protein
MAAGNQRQAAFSEYESICDQFGARDRRSDFSILFFHSAQNLIRLICPAIFCRTHVMRRPFLIMLSASISILAPYTTAGTITFDDLPIGSVPDGVYNGDEVTIITSEQHRVRSVYASAPIYGTATIQNYTTHGSTSPFIYSFPTTPLSEETLKYLADNGLNLLSVNRYIFVDVDFQTPVNTVSFDIFRGFFGIILTTTGTLSTGDQFRESRNIGGVAAWEQIDLTVPEGGLVNHLHFEAFQNGFSEIGFDSLQYSHVPESGSTALLLGVGCLGAAAFRIGNSRREVTARKVWELAC